MRSGCRHEVAAWLRGCRVGWQPTCETLKSYVLRRSSKAGTFGTNVSACHNRKIREGWAVVAQVEGLCRLTGESDFSKVNELVWFPEMKLTLLLVLVSQGNWRGSGNQNLRLTLRRYFIMTASVPPLAVSLMLSIEVVVWGWWVVRAWLRSGGSCVEGKNPAQKRTVRRPEHGTDG